MNKFNHMIISALIVAFMIGVLVGVLITAFAI